MARPIHVGRLPVLAIAAGILLAILAITLTLWSTNLVKRERYADCGRHANALTTALDVDLRQCLRQVAELGDLPPEVMAVWWLGPNGVEGREPADAADPPPHLIESTRSLSGDHPFPLSSDDAALAATWVPRSGKPGLLVQWNVKRVEARLLRRLERSAPDYRAVLLGADRAEDTIPFRAKGFARPAPPFAFWRIAVGLKDSGSTRRLLRLQAWLLGTLAVWLLVVLAGSVALNARAQRTLAERQQARDRLLARATHELQTPLALIRAAAETIQRGAADRPQDVARCADIMVREEERLTRTIRRLLRYLRLESAPNLEDDQVSVRAEVARAVEDDQGTFQARGVSLDVVLDEVEVQTPRCLIADAVSELLANARKHAEGASRVSVRLQRTETGARLTVEDDGPGLSQETRARLFLPWSEEAGADPKQRGSGLGLALILEGLAQVGGTITCDGSASGGRFVIEIPRG
jgi:signal transduction histidine kinase